MAGASGRGKAGLSTVGQVASADWLRDQHPGQIGASGMRRKLPSE